MNASDKKTCRQCGADVPANATENLCPACLLSGALQPPDSQDKTVVLAEGELPTSSAPSDLPCAFGEYRLLGTLGRGGMGTVYEAEQIATGRRVALKMLGSQLDSPDLRKRFLREGRLAARVNHPNSLYIFGSEEIEGHPVITMEIAGGGTLQDRLKAHGPLPVAEAVDAILDVISGLESALAAGVLHRDIKPSNCFLCPDGSVKVGDYGLSVSTLAKTDSFVTAHGMIMGTPAFASPEQLRGDALDVRADIYSVAATLFTLLTNRAPFEGDNAVQVVANAVNQAPPPLTELRDDVPPALARVVARCLAKDPAGRYPDYTALRNALLPFGSEEPQPASMKARVTVGWPDYLIAFLIPYLVLMTTVGFEDLLLRPLVERTLISARYHIAMFAFGFLYFSIAEGIWGAGVGKRIKGLRVVRTNGRRPGIVRALVRILIPILCIEGVRFPVTLTFISNFNLSGVQIFLFILVINACAWIPVLLTLTARRENGWATVWDLATGTRVVVKPKATERPTVEPPPQPEAPADVSDSLGPFLIIHAMDQGKWIVATDPVLRRPVWLLRRDGSEPSPRRNLARAGRLRWLQKVETDDATWDAYDAPPGVPFPSLVEGEEPVPWSSLRHWLHDLAVELWEATGDLTLPAELGLDHVWVTAQGQVVLLDEPWPEAEKPSECVPVGDLAGQQRFLNKIAAHVESTRLPLHARGVLKNLEDGRFEKLSFLAGALRGMLDKPADVSRGVRAAAIFMLPCYCWVLSFVGYYQGPTVQQWSGAVGQLALLIAVAVLSVFAVAQILELPFRSTASHSIFRLVVVDTAGRPAGIPRLLLRWTVVWIPLLLPLSLVALLVPRDSDSAFFVALALLLFWGSTALHTVFHPHRGLHDRLAGTWVVRR